MKYQRFAALVLAAALLTGCGGTQSSPSAAADQSSDSMFIVRPIISGCCCIKHCICTLPVHAHFIFGNSGSCYFLLSLIHI